MDFLKLFKSLFVNNTDLENTAITNRKPEDVRMLFIGPSRVGKSFLINCIFGRQNSRAIPTEGLSYDTLTYFKDDCSYDILITELGGDETMKKLRKPVFLFKDTIIFVFNVNSVDSYNEVKEIVSEFSECDPSKISATQTFFLCTTLSKSAPKYFNSNDMEDMNNLIGSKIKTENVRIHFVEIRLDSMEDCNSIMNYIISESINHKFGC